MLDKKPVRLILAGDVMTGRGIDQVLPCPGDPLIHESYLHSARGYVSLAEKHNGAIPYPVTFDYIWGEALAAMDARQPALRIINLETAITTSDDYWPGKGINYRMHPGNIPCLTAANIDACCLANNHVLDWGYQGLTDTLETLRQTGIRLAGAGKNLDTAAAPATLTAGDQRLLLFAFGHASSGVPLEWAAGRERPGVNLLGGLSEESARRVSDSVSTYRQPGDLVAISIHWGGNWGYHIAAQQRAFARLLIEEAGADLVFGHSSHHPLGIEVHRGRPILYGCGDLINDYEGIGGREEYRSALRLLYCLDLEPGSGTLQRLELMPFEMCRFRLQQISGSDSDWLLHTLRHECLQLGTDVVPAKTNETFLLRW